MTKLLGLLTGALGGIWGYVAAAVFAAALSVGATHWIDAKGYGITIANLKADAANQKAANVTAALAQLQGFINKMQNADAGYNGDLANIKKQFAALELEFKNATAKPLPLDCKPDAGRVRILSAAVAATNAKAASTGK